jgi:hypothetical protein
MAALLKLRNFFNFVLLTSQLAAAAKSSRDASRHGIQISMRRSWERRKSGDFDLIARQNKGVLISSPSAYSPDLCTARFSRFFF